MAAGQDTKRDRARSGAIADFLEFTPETKGMGVARFFLGEPGDRDTPLVLLTSFPPNFAVGPHKHDSEYVEIVLQGRVRVGRTWYEAGEIRQVPEGQVYGPLLTGDEGVTVAVIYRSNSSTPISPKCDTSVPFGPVDEASPTAE